MGKIRDWKEKKYYQSAEIVSKSLDWLDDFNRDCILYNFQWADDELRKYTETELYHVRSLTEKVVSGEVRIAKAEIEKRHKRVRRYAALMNFYKKEVVALEIFVHALFHAYMIPQFLRLDFYSFLLRF